MKKAWITPLFFLSASIFLLSHQLLAVRDTDGDLSAFKGPVFKRTNRTPERQAIRDKQKAARKAEKKLRKTDRNRVAVLPASTMENRSASAGVVPLPRSLNPIQPLKEPEPPLAKPNVVLAVLPRAPIQAPPVPVLRRPSVAFDERLNGYLGEDMVSTLQRSSYANFSCESAANPDFTDDDLSQVAHALKSAWYRVRFNSTFQASDFYPYVTAGNMRKFAKVIGAANLGDVTVNNTGWNTNVTYPNSYIEPEALGAFIDELSHSQTLHAVKIEGMFLLKSAQAFCTSFKGKLPFHLQFDINPSYAFTEEATRLWREHTQVAWILRQRFGGQVTFAAPAYYRYSGWGSPRCVWSLSKEAGNTDQREFYLNSPGSY